MKKRNFWPLLFIGLFTFTFSMIVWTIYSAVNTPVYEDRSFLKSYQELDENFNQVVEANKNFKEKYNFELVLNERKFPLVIDDVFKAQRVIEKKSKHKKVFFKGKNKISISITNKIGVPIESAKINLRVSRPTNHKSTMDFTSEDFKYIDGKYIKEMTLPLKGNWNITGNFLVGDDIAYFYLKSDAVER